MEPVSETKFDEVPATTPALKPGYKTTEFWISLTSQLLAVAVAFGCISAADATTIGGAVTQVVTGLAAIVGAITSATWYTSARTELKWR
jgi:hypothetical protein